VPLRIMMGDGILLHLHLRRLMTSSLGNNMMFGVEVLQVPPMETSHQ
jgi:hypothetical protein